MPARYLLRFDDIAPSMNWDVWRRVEPVLTGAGIQPLVAVVPANVDAELDVGPPEPNFWDKVRDWQARGWSIGLHGFEHRYVTKSAGILGRNPYSEFAGLSEGEQRRKLESALAIFRREGVRADAWVAPAHSFDEVTVDLLRQLDVDCISDGYAMYPYRCERGMTWIPQQLGKFWPLPFGVWTVCLHVNDWTGRDIENFRSAVTARRSRIGSLAEVRTRYGGRRRCFSDELFGGSFRALRALRGLS